MGCKMRRKNKDARKSISERFEMSRVQPFVDSFKQFKGRMLTAIELYQLGTMNLSEIESELGEYTDRDTDPFAPTLKGRPIISRTIVGYVEPGRPFGSTIISPKFRSGVRFILPVPKELAMLKNAAIVTEDYDLEEDGKRLVIRTNKITVVQNFPTTYKYGWFERDFNTMLPVGKPVSDEGDSKIYFHRLPRMLGPIYELDDLMYDPDPLSEFYSIARVKNQEELASEQMNSVQRFVSGAANELEGLGKLVKGESIENLREIVRRLKR